MRLVIKRGHTTERMEARGITRGDIENALRNHHTRIESLMKESVTYIGPGLNGRELKVYTLLPGYVDDDTPVTIKSSAWKEETAP